MYQIRLRGVERLDVREQREPAGHRPGPATGHRVRADHRSGLFIEPVVVELAAVARVIIAPVVGLAMLRVVVLIRRWWCGASRLRRRGGSPDAHHSDRLAGLGRWLYRATGVELVRAQRARARTVRAGRASWRQRPSCARLSRWLYH